MLNKYQNMWMGFLKVFGRWKYSALLLSNTKQYYNFILITKKTFALS